MSPISSKRGSPSAASTSPSLRSRASVKAPLVAEELGLQQGRGIDPQFSSMNGPGGADRPVQSPSDQLLAGAGLAGNEHGGRFVVARAASASRMRTRVDLRRCIGGELPISAATPPSLSRSR